MQNPEHTHLNQLALRLGLALCAVLVPVSAAAEIEDGQSFRPIQWKSDFSSTNSLSISVLGLSGGSQIIEMNQKRVNTAYGLQLGQSLREHWSGRVALFLGRVNEPEDVQYWSHLVSDLRRPAIPESLFKEGFFRIVRPYLFFGLGVVSKWSQATLKANLIPTLRYDVSEPAITAGLQLVGVLGNEVLAGVEYRFLQSARTSRIRGGALGLSLIWGQIEK